MPQHYSKENLYKHLREGILLRVQPLDKAVELLLQQGTKAQDQSNIFEVFDWEKETHPENNFLEIITNEYRLKVASWKRQLELESESLQLFPSKDITIGNDLTSNASVGWSTFRFPLKNPPLYPGITINIGLILAVEDLLGQCLSTATFYTPKGKLDISNPSFRIGSAHRNRYIDYGPLLFQQEHLASFKLTRHIPISPWRLYQLDLLSELAIHWAMLHEQAHWMLGHLDYLHTFRKGGEGVFRMNEGPRNKELKAVISQEEYHYFEMSADALATALLFHFYWPIRKNKHSPFGIYNSKLIASYGNPIPFHSILKIEDDVTILRTFLSAISTVLILFEQQRSRHGHGGTYPMPSTRLLSIFLSLGQAYQEFDTLFNKDNSDNSLKKIIQSYIHTTVDVQLAISLLEIKNPIFQPFFWDQKDQEEKDNFSNDLFSLISGDLTLPEKCKSAAAKEFLKLKALDHKIEPLLKKFLHLGPSWVGM